MSFTSTVFAFFFVAVAIFYYVLPVKFRWLCLLAASVFFYMYAGPVYVLVPLFIILITWYAGLQIERAVSATRARQLYILAIVANIGVLVFFKYTDFFTSSIYYFINIFRQKIFHAGDMLNNPLLINVIAPLGISYITFQAIGYLIEIKRGSHTAEKNFGYFATFLLFFPKIIAGPIERAHNFLPQLKQKKAVDYYGIGQGLKLILKGLLKKLVIADRLGLYVNTALDQPELHTGATILIAVVFYVFQIYTDFSGYTDMALGFAKILGFDLTENFKRPLLAKSVTEFWRKWHISLSTWFADYFYTPIAIAKRDWGDWSVGYAFFVTFIVLGFWHGANWTFMVFGALQGLILTIEFFTRKARKKIRKKIPAFINDTLGIAFTFSYFAFTMIFFRSNNAGQVSEIFKKIVHLKGPVYFGNSKDIFLYGLIFILLLIAYEIKEEFFPDSIRLLHNNHVVVRYAFYLFSVAVILLFGVFDGGQFIYFQF